MIHEEPMPHLYSRAEFGIGFYQANEIQPNPHDIIVINGLEDDYH